MFPRTNLKQWRVGISPCLPFHLAAATAAAALIPLAADGLQSGGSSKSDLERLLWAKPMSNRMTPGSWSWTSMPLTGVWGLAMATETEGLGKGHCLSASARHGAGHQKGARA